MNPAEILHAPEPIAKILRKDETLLWHGQPRTDFLFVPSDWLLVPISVGILALAICFLKIASGTPAFYFAAGWSLLVALVPIVRFAVDIVKRHSSYYLVTDKRIAIINDSMLDRTVRSKEYDSNFTMTAIDGPRDTATIYFGPASRISCLLFPPNYPLTEMYSPPYFMFLDDANAVMDLILKAKRKAITR